MPELRRAYEMFNEEVGKEQEIISTYRPQEYQDHIRSVWDAWQSVNGREFTIRDPTDPEDGMKKHPPADWRAYAALREGLREEVRRHGIADTRPWRRSDHSLGIAIDIVPPAVTGPVYREWIRKAASLPAPYALCHYIAGDEPHFALKSRLPPGTDCLRE